MRDVPAPVFTCGQAYADGWTPSALGHAIRRGRVVRLRRGVYADCAHRDDPDAFVRAAALAYPSAVVSHRSAALLHGLPRIGPAPAFPEVTVVPRADGNLAGVRVHRATLRPQDVVVLDDVVVTSAPRTVIDVARHRPLSHAVACLDAALHDDLATEEELADVLRHCWNWPRIRRAQCAVRHADARSESPLESVSRLTLVLLEVARPELQTSIFSPGGQFVARADFYWDEFGVVGEADGRSKYIDRSDLVREKERQENLEELGLVVVRWGWSDVTRRPRYLRARLERAFERGRRRDGSGFPRLWTL